MKKIIICLLVMFVAVFALTGCQEKNTPVEEGTFLTMEEVISAAKANTKGKGGSVDYTVTGTPNFEVPEGGYDGSAVTITFYHTMGQNLSAVLDEYLQEFYKLYPNITVNHKQVGGYDDVRSQISTEITTNSQPNLAYCYPDHVALYNVSGAVATLDNLIDSTASDGRGGQLGLTQAQKDDFIEGYYNEGRQFGDGLMYSMPFSKSTEVLYYNKTFFAENNIQVPDHWFMESENDTTAMEYVCKKILEIDPYSIPLGYDSEANWFITMCEQIGSDYTTNAAGSSHFLFNNAYNRTVFREFRNWYKETYVTTQAIYGAYTSGLFTSTDQSKSYMSIGSSAGATHQRPAKVDEAYPFEVGIAPIPQMNKDNPKVISQGPSLTIFNKSNPQEVIASWLLVKFLTTSVEFQAQFSMVSGYVPVIKSVAENEVYKADFLDKADGYDYVAALSAKVCLEQADYYYTSPAFNGSSKARDEVGALVPAVFALADSNLDAQIVKVFQDAVDNCKFFAGE